MIRPIIEVIIEEIPPYCLTIKRSKAQIHLMLPKAMKTEDLGLVSISSCDISIMLWKNYIPNTDKQAKENGWDSKDEKPE